jgi:hypothetical protein
MSTTYADKIDAIEDLAPRTAGALPSTRTFNMVTDALQSGDVEHLQMELQHTRAHYQSLEYMLNDEGAILTAINAEVEAGRVPKPETPEEALQLAVRVYSKVVLDAAYDNAHEVGFFVAVLGMSVQDALQQIYGRLDFSDPERELTDEELAALSGQAVDTEED